MSNASASPCHQEDVSQQMPLDLSPLFHNFFSTTDGIDFLADTMHTLEGQLGALCRKAKPDVQQLNAILMSHFQSFILSEKGKALSSGLDKEMSSGTLAVPVFLIERLIKQRLQSMAQQNAQRLIVFFCWRGLFGALAVQAVKSGIRALARRFCGRRVVAAVNFSTEVLLSTHFLGAALGLSVGVMELTGRMHIPGVRYQSGPAALGPGEVVAQRGATAAGTAVAQAITAIAGPGMGAVAGQVTENAMGALQEQFTDLAGVLI